MASTTSAYDAVVLQGEPVGLWLGGQYVPSRSGEIFAVEDPATHNLVAEVADADAADAAIAMDLACSAAEPWAARTPRARSEVLRRAYELLMHQADDLATLVTLEMGKPLAESRAEVQYAAEYFLWFSEEAVRIDGRSVRAPHGGGQLVTSWEPVGPCILVTPWNFPIAMGARKIAPAIAAGCTMILKPAQQTPVTALVLAALLQQAGLPDGVLGVLPTTDPAAVVGELTADTRARKLSFTGSTRVGRQLARQASDQLLRVSLELGGNAPFIVLRDADIASAVRGALIAKMRNGGEACTAANRILVDYAVMDEFVAEFSSAVAALRVGSGLDPDVDIGPLIDARQRDAVAGLVNDAIARGASPVVGGAMTLGPGYFFEPTVLVDVPTDSRILHEEIFGPVAPIVPVSGLDEAVEMANATEYGLAAYVYTQDATAGYESCRRLQAGMVGLNQGVVSNVAAPFGGVKHSGYGREGGAEGIREYLQLKYVAVSGA
jgi:succinate-semialdehyde dehydrogenase/glutarate-semialdehyde dehydrogenase